MNKMVLVPEAHVEELKRLRLYQNGKLPPKPEILQTVEIQRNIDELMADPNISSTDKMYKLNNYMTKYNSFKDQATDSSEPSKAPTYNKDTKEYTSTPDETIIESIPKGMRKNAQIFLEQIKLNTDITWNAKGVISINGKVIADSNINDIINDAARERKSRTNAVGWLDVAEELKNKKQKITVGNKRWNTFVNTDTNKEVNKASSKRKHTPITYQTKRKTSKTTKKPTFDSDSSYTSYTDVDEEHNDKKWSKWE